MYDPVKEHILKAHSYVYNTVVFIFLVAQLICNVNKDLQENNYLLWE